MAHKKRKYYSPRHYDGDRPSRIHMLWMALVVAAVFAAALWGIHTLGSWLEPEPVEVYGSLEGRFEPTLTLEQQGRTYVHQELDYTTILLIGVDKTSLDSSALRGGGQADFLLLLTIDQEQKVVHSLQIDRDTVTAVQVYGAFGHPAGVRNTQICLSYAFGNDPEKACQNTVKAVSDLLEGVPIDHYIAMDMEGMFLLNDALGGVTVTLEEDFTEYDPAMTAGATLTLQGAQAEYFLRSRMTVGDGTNKARMNRQAAFMNGAAELLMQKMAEDPEYVNELLKKLEAHLVASCDSGWLINQAYTASQYPRAEMSRLSGEHTIGKDGFVEFHPDRNDLMVYIIETFCK